MSTVLDRMHKCTAAQSKQRRKDFCCAFYCFRRFLLYWRAFTLPVGSVRRPSPVSHQKRGSRGFGGGTRNRGGHGGTPYDRQIIDPQPPSPPSECVLPPAPQAGGTHSPGGEGGGNGGQYFGTERYRIGLLQYNLSTTIPLLCCWGEVVQGDPDLEVFQ